MKLLNDLVTRNMHRKVNEVQGTNDCDLQNSRTRFLQLVDWAPLSIAMFDLDMRYVELSQGWRDDCRIGNRNVIGLTHYELFPELPERWKEVHRRCLAGATERCESDLFPRPDGTTVWIRWEVKPWRNESGDIGGIVMWTEDITERKLAQAKLRENDRRFETALANSPMSVWEQDLDLRYTWFYNPKLGYACEEVIGKTDAELMDPTFVGELEALKRRVLETGKSARQEVMAAAPGEPLQFYDLSIDALRDEAGRIIGITCASAEITERKRIEEELKESEQRFRGAFETAGHGMVLVSVEGRFLKVNSAICALLGYSEAELLATDFQKITHPDDLVSDILHLSQLRSNQIQSYQIEKRYFHKNGRIVWTSLSVSVVRSSSGAIRNFVSHIHDITERKRSLEQIHSMAFHDALTGLPNRSLLKDRLAQALTASKRTECYGALMVLDLDNFKILNDTHGHEVGDRLLVEAANRLTNCVRESDTVARFGGDEFVVMLGELNKDRSLSIAQAKIVAEKIINTLAEPYRLTTINKHSAHAVVEHVCTASIGVVIFIDSQVAQTEILNGADKAMYEAKSAGRNAVRFAPETLTQAG